tara:strand:- start:25450 stop:27087 length:1638 start_codon:yes stop_codon:yes gene_type:complete
MGTNTYTLPVEWRSAVPLSTLFPPVRVGDVVVAGALKSDLLLAFSATDGSEVWQRKLPGSLRSLVAAPEGILLGHEDAEGATRIVQIDESGAEVWELEDRWQLVRGGLVIRGERMLLAGHPANDRNTRGLWEFTIGDSKLQHFVAGDPRGRPIALETGGWAWVDTTEEPWSLHRFCDGEDATMAVGHFDALVTRGDLLCAKTESDIVLFRDGAEIWRRPGATSALGASEVVGAIADSPEDDTDIVCYELDGSLRWRTGPYEPGMPDVLVWGPVVICTIVTMGEKSGVVVLDLATGREVFRECERGRGASTFVIDEQGTFALSPEQISRRSLKVWQRIEDAWDPSYLAAFAEQLGNVELEATEAAGTRPIPALVEELREAGANITSFVGEVSLPEPLPNLDELRNAVAAVRKNITEKPGNPRDPRCLRKSNWPLMHYTLCEESQGHMVGMLSLDDLEGEPELEELHRVAGYSQLQFLSLRALMLQELPQELGLQSLVNLEFLSLAGNALRQLPPVLRHCTAPVVSRSTSAKRPLGYEPPLAADHCI